MNAAVDLKVLQAAHFERTSFISQVFSRRGRQTEHLHQCQCKCSGGNEICLKKQSVKKFTICVYARIKPFPNSSAEYKGRKSWSALWRSPPTNVPKSKVAVPILLSNSDTRPEAKAAASDDPLQFLPPAELSTGSNLAKLLSPPGKTKWFLCRLPAWSLFPLLQSEARKR